MDLFTQPRLERARQIVAEVTRESEPEYGGNAYDDGIPPLEPKQHWSAMVQIARGHEAHGPIFPGKGKGRETPEGRAKLLSRWVDSDDPQTPYMRIAELRDLAGLSWEQCRQLAKHDLTLGGRRFFRGGPGVHLHRVVVVDESVLWKSLVLAFEANGIRRESLSRYADGRIACHGGHRWRLATEAEIVAAKRAALSVTRGVAV